MFDHLVGNEVDLAVTAAVMLASVVGAVWARYQSKKPVQVGRIRWVNYSAVIMICGFVFLMCAAHFYTLFTGNQLEPRRRRGM